MMLDLALRGLLTAAILTMGAAMATAGNLDADRQAQLNLGNPEQRVEVLSWLAEHGDTSDTKAVLPRLKDDDTNVRQFAEITLWSMWLRSRDAEADGWMQVGANLMSSGQPGNAIALFSRIIAKLPDFPEGYNKRATALYLEGNFQASLDDIAETLKRNPDHFGALSGAGLCLMRLDRAAEALFYFERALAVNPNMEGIQRLVEGLRGLKPRPTI